jgi:hypothetical protein
MNEEIMKENSCRLMLMMSGWRCRLYTTAATCPGNHFLFLLLISAILGSQVLGFYHLI